MVIEHPFDNKMVRLLAHARTVVVTDLDTLWPKAFILTRGKTHYRTLDRGKSWQHFEMPLTPALIGRPLSFHSDPAKWGYILYQGTACENSGGWGDSCHDEVRIVSIFALLPAFLSLVSSSSGGSSACWHGLQSASLLFPSAGWVAYVAAGNIAVMMGNLRGIAIARLCRKVPALQATYNKRRTSGQRWKLRVRLWRAPPLG